MLNIKYSGFADEISPDTTQQFEHLNTLGIEYPLCFITITFMTL